MSQRTLMALVLVLLLTAGTTRAGGMIQPGEATQPRITVAGTATISVAPDTITWSLTLEHPGATQLEAKQGNDAAAEAMVAAIRELEIADADVTTERVSIRPVYEKDENGNDVFDHYAARRSITVTQRDMARFDEYFQKLAELSGALLSFSAGSSRLHELRWEARLEAMRTARRKAEELATLGGATLGKPLLISERDPWAQPSGYNPSQFFLSNTGSFAPTNVPPGAPQPDAIQGTYAPGSVSVTETVHVTFALE